MHAKAIARAASALARLSQDFLTVADNETELGSGGFEWEDQLAPNSLGFAGATSFELSNSIISEQRRLRRRRNAHPRAVDQRDRFLSPTLSAVVPGTMRRLDRSDRHEREHLGGSESRLRSSCRDFCGPTIDAGDPSIDLGDPRSSRCPTAAASIWAILGNTASATRTFPDVNGDGTIDGLDIIGIAVSRSAR